MNNYNIVLNYFNKKYNTDKSFNKILLKLLSAYEKGSVCINIDDKEIKLLNKFNVVGEDKPLYLNNDLLYFQKYYYLELNIIKKIQELINQKKFKMITGGPGTGKTTKVSTELANKLALDINYVIALAAPTGKASIRMKESLNNTLRGASYSVEEVLKGEIEPETIEEIITKIESLQPITIHNLIGAFPQRTDYQYKKRKLEKHIIVIDEASMIDINLMEKLLTAVDNDVLDTLYLIGDKNQLTSVDVGSVFKDLSESITDNKIQEVLTVNYRSKSAVGIQNLIKDIENENIDEISKFNYHNVNFMGFENNIIENEFISNLVNKYLNIKTVEEGLDLIKESIILSAYKVGLSGSIFINHQILKKYEKLRFVPYILTKNDYNRNLYNGDIGILDKSNNLVYFENGVVVEFFYLVNVEPAFCITIHKSQGSEYDNVLLVMKKDDIESSFITKELIYTGVSRAKKTLEIMSGKETFIKGIKTKANRASGLSEVRWNKWLLTL